MWHDDRPELPGGRVFIDYALLEELSETRYLAIIGAVEATGLGREIRRTRNGEFVIYERVSSRFVN